MSDSERRLPSTGLGPGKPAPAAVKEIAGGWMTERVGTDVPVFLKFCYVVIALGCLAYCLLYINGEVSHADRGPLVQQLNAVTGDANTFMYIVAALAVVFAVVLWRYAFSKPHEE